MVKINTAKISIRLRKKVANEFRAVVERRKRSLTKRMGSRIKNSIRKSPTYRALIGARSGLRGQLGLTNAQSKLKAILEALAQDIEVTVDSNPFSKSTGSYRMQAVRSDFSTILQLPEAVQDPEGRGSVTIPWLNWLLRSGGSEVTSSFGVRKNIRLGRGVIIGRSGLPYIMIEIGRFGTQNRYIVPSNHQGVAGNNFITRALEESREDFRAFLKEIGNDIKQGLKGV